MTPQTFPKAADPVTFYSFRDASRWPGSCIVIGLGADRSRGAIATVDTLLAPARNRVARPGARNVGAKA